MRRPPFRFVTPRIVLRSWEPDDAEALVGSLRRNLDHLRPWMPWARNEKLDVEEKRGWLEARRRLFESGRDFAWGMFDRAEERVIGAVGLHRRIGAAAGEIGYWVDSEHVGRGLCTEAVGAVVCGAFASLRPLRLEIQCDVANVASAAVPRKLGFTLQVTIPARVHTPAARPVDTMVWSMHRRAWPSSPAAACRAEAADAIGRPLPLRG